MYHALNEMTGNEKSSNSHPNVDYYYLASTKLHSPQLTAIYEWLLQTCLQTRGLTHRIFGLNVIKCI